MTSITLEDILEAREARTARRRRMQEEYALPCLSLSMNIPGPVKDSPCIRALFRHAAGRIAATLPVTACRTAFGVTGPHGVFIAPGDAARLKEAACRLEAENDYSRLLDLDVYDPDGTPVAGADRVEGRTCFLCDRPSAVCMREKRHPPEALAEHVRRLFTSFHADMSRHISVTAARYAALAMEAMLFEASCAPSPGLVDPLHSGSHKDMDFFTFMRGSAALGYGLQRCAQAGLQHDGPAPYLLPVLRRIGLETEKDMLSATGGVNTHKGFLFSMGLSLGATGLLRRGEKDVTPRALGALLGRMTCGIVTGELGGCGAKTAGERMYREFGITGIRGEVEAGLPSVLDAGLPALKKALRAGMDANRALLIALTALMTRVEDTTILARSPRLETLRAVQAKARAILDSGLLEREAWRETLWDFDRELVARNLSPGGSADLLALTWYMYRLEREQS